MPDRKPARSVGDERETLRILLQFQRDSLMRKVEGLDHEAATRVLVPSGTTLLWLVTHMTFAENVWVVRRFLGEDDGPVDSAVDEGAMVASALAAYRAMSARVDGVVAESGLDDLCRDPGPEGQVNLRWVLGHLLEETARHAGHADILRELIDGQTGR